MKRKAKKSLTNNELLNDAFYHSKAFLFSLHTYSHSFIKLRLNYLCHMDYFNDVFTTFLGPECFSCIAVYARSESLRFHQKYLNLCSEDERRSYGFGTT